MLKNKPHETILVVFKNIPWNEHNELNQQSNQQLTIIFNLIVVVQGHENKCEATKFLQIW